ncbi:radical SAM protein [Arabiibacter massiliensis]|uniref:radical SAM protein n=1 Tax=Arabiibacter massiliensis TaxID=1870985 RepID=UPI0009BC53EA|nr:radical SAM protein [Arabiibacter massiliensis]
MRNRHPERSAQQTSFCHPERSAQQTSFCHPERSAQQTSFCHPERAKRVEGSRAASANGLPAVCDLCPRACGADRAAGERGACGADGRLVVARAALHFWEEPPISGSRGSGTVFFAFCPLRCVYCQNAVIAAGEAGAEVSVERLAEMFLELQAQGALNVNLVTPTHYAPEARAAVALARRQGLALPVVWNTSGYESVEAVRANAGTVDVYLTDFKYADAGLAARYSHAPDYPEVALAALAAMVEEAGEPAFDEVDGEPRLVRGVVVRHLMLPGALEDSKRVVRLVHERFGGAVLLSLMNQYTPVRAFPDSPELERRVSYEDYGRLLDYADELGIEDYFWQEGGAAEESFIPPFDLTGV